MPRQLKNQKQRTTSNQPARHLPSEIGIDNGYGVDLVARIIVRVPANIASVVDEVHIGNRVFTELQSRTGVEVDLKSEKVFIHEMRDKKTLTPDPSPTGEGKQTRGSMVTQRCEACHLEFKYKLWTRPRRFCDHCKVTRNSESIRESAKQKKSKLAKPPYWVESKCRNVECRKMFSYDKNVQAKRLFCSAECSAAADEAGEGEDD